MPREYQVPAKEETKPTSAFRKSLQFAVVTTSCVLVFLAGYEPVQGDVVLV